jgi:hypothetical protein
MDLSGSAGSAQAVGEHYQLDSIARVVIISVAVRILSANGSHEVY